MGLSPPTRSLSTFGWSLAGAVLLAASFAPVGVYPVAWVALVPILSRWARRDATWAYARELYAVFLTTSCLAGFWLLFHPVTSQAVQGGVGLFLVPIPLVASFLGAAYARQRWGLSAGLALLAANVVATEYLLLHSPLHAPWLLLGHTQAVAVPFIQMADVGGVLLLSAWVMALNVTVFLALPVAPSLPKTWSGRLALLRSDRPGLRSLAVATVALLVALPLAYSTARLDAIDGIRSYLRVGIVQPNITPRDWSDPAAKDRVAYLADLSNSAVKSWRGGLDSLGSVRPVSLRRAGSAGEPVGLLIWPQGALPHLGSQDRQRALLDRLDRWSERMNVGLLAGAEVLEDDAGRPVQASVFLNPKAPPQVSDRTIHSPLFDGVSGTGAGGRVKPFVFGHTQIASVVGFESLFGEHVQDVTAGADLLVALTKTDQWGHSPGIYQHLAFTRLRAVETRRSVIVSSVRGVSAVIRPDGSAERVAGWKDQGVVSLDVPMVRETTVYASWGDWVGLLGLGLAVVGNAAALGVRRKPRVPER